MNKMNNSLNRMNNSLNRMNNNKISEEKKNPPFGGTIPMLSIKDIIIGSVGTVIPWTILLLIVGFIIII